MEWLDNEWKLNMREGYQDDLVMMESKERMTLLRCHDAIMTDYLLSR